MSTKHEELCEDTEEEMEPANSTIENINVPKSRQEALEWIEGLKMFTRTVEDTATSQLEPQLQGHHQLHIYSLKDDSS
ncbi:hypothetical protein J437_LFUL013121 [Ladona fulva]|uniref:Uncharacterized protein n=1 Tax=Ladona fulva TaxID=123851 RepID=A0A8K0KKK1_LADFU|nr:hypothetical protein J437_LFUL013121 [Ladona fulva]